jgi:hypothetical protein
VGVAGKLQQFASCVEIAHHVPGRIRLRLLPGASARAEAVPGAGALKDALGSLPGIRSVRINALARSCTIEYDPLAIPFQAWPDFLGNVRSEAAGVLRRIVSNQMPDGCAEIAEAGRA